MASPRSTWTRRTSASRSPWSGRASGSTWRWRAVSSCTAWPGCPRKRATGSTPRFGAVPPPHPPRASATATTHPSSAGSLSALARHDPALSARLRQWVRSPLLDLDRARALRMGAARRVVVDHSGREVHDEHVDQGVLLGVLPRHVQLVVADRHRHVVLGRKLRADERSRDRDALHRSVLVRLTERVALVAAQAVVGVEHVAVQVEALDARPGLGAVRADGMAGPGRRDGAGHRRVDPDRRAGEQHRRRRPHSYGVTHASSPLWTMGGRSYGGLADEIRARRTSCAQGQESVRAVYATCMCRNIRTL